MGKEEEIKAAIKYHENFGKIGTRIKTPIKKMDDLVNAYTPGVANVYWEIEKNPDLLYTLTPKGRWVLVVSDGTAVLGDGQIGAAGAIPVMDGKALLFMAFSGLDASYLCIDTKQLDPGVNKIDFIVNLVKSIAVNFGGICLEDIKAPECFEIERRLQDIGIPVMHDDQWGTSVVVAAAIINSLKVVGKSIYDIKIVVNGAGASAIATTKTLLSIGAKHIIMCDSTGIIYRGRSSNMNEYKEEMARLTNEDNLQGTLAGAMKEANVFIGLSVAGVVSQDMVRSMAKNPIVFGMANPIPEIFPEEALEAGARIAGSGRSDLQNQINNCWGFPGIFKGALVVRTAKITQEMKVAAAHALAGCIENPTEGEVLPSIFDENRIIKMDTARGIANAIAIAVAKSAMETGVARLHFSDEELKEEIEKIKYK